jgi:hypothetical protein
MIRTTTVFLSAILALAAASSDAALILQYGTANVTSLAPVIVNPGVTGDNLVAGSGLSLQTGSTFNFSQWDVASTTFAAAVAANDFWTFGFDVVSALPLTLTDMDIRLDRSNTGPTDVAIEASVNGGAGIPVLSFAGVNAAGQNFLGVSLSGIPTLVTGDSLVFTLAAFRSGASTGTFDLETITFPGGNDGIAIRGEFIPEPGSALIALLGLAGAGMVSMRARLG